MSKGNLFVISGPSGSGKDTVLAGVFEKCPELKFSISAITRPMREGETPDGKYRFVSREQFEDMIKNGELLEHNVFVGNYYGTPKKYVVDCLNNGDDVMIEVDVNGARKIKEKMPEAVLMFVCPPSLEVLKHRLTRRGTDAPEVIEKRLKVAIDEIKCAKMYDYIVVNDALEDAIDNAVAIIKTAGLKTENNTDIIDGIVNK
ncbi:MAG: guanylate kinase [Clostridia bacterium]|nr:guanylate kinase [Clostridia bacterium]